MTFDATAILRLDALQSLGTSASGVSLATSTGDIFEVTCYGPGVFRLRAGPSTKPDYGLVVGRAKACAVEPGEGGAWKFTAGDATLELAAAPLRFRLLHRGAPVAGSITDEHFRGWTRLPAFGRARQGGQWTAALALASGEPVYGLGEKFGPLNKRGQLIHSRVVDAHGVNTGQSLQEHAVRVESRHRQGRVGRVRQHAGERHARRRAPGLVAPLVRAAGRRRGARPLPLRGRHARGHPRSLHAAHGPPGVGPAVEPGTVGFARLLQDARGSRGRGRETPRAQDSLRRADARRPRRLAGRDALRFRMGSRPFSGSARRARCDQGAQPQDLRLGIPLCVRALAVVRRPRVARLSADQRRPAIRTSSAGTRRPAQAPSARCPRPCPKAASSISRTPAPTCGGATRTPSCSPTAST